MKLAFLGNCQLQQIGALLEAFFRQQNMEHEVIWHAPIFALGDHQAEVVPIFHTLAQADRIYGQFHESRWNAFSSGNLAKYFDIRIVPTLESLASFPQMNYFSKGPLNLNLYSVDFRMLELYLGGTTPDRVPGVYTCAIVDERRRRNLIDNTASKYRTLFQKGQTIFDYADTYLAAMQQATDPYFVHNHPDNAQLEWLTNQILADAGIVPGIRFGELPERLTDTIVPALNGQPAERYRVRATEVGIKTATKINYTFFSTYERSFLEDELERSNYKALCSGEL